MSKSHTLAELKCIIPKYCAKFKFNFLYGIMVSYMHICYQLPTYYLTQSAYAFWIVYSRSAAKSWWRHDMKTFSMLLALCVGNPPATLWFPSQRVSNAGIEVLLDMNINKLLNKQSNCHWFENYRPLFEWRYLVTQWMYEIICCHFFFYWWISCTCKTQQTRN